MIRQKFKAMNQPFEIKFDFALAHSDLIISLSATADLHHSDPYYVVDNFHLASSTPTKNGLSIIPAQEIKKIKRGDAEVWVHKDSERESMLSLAIGRAIDGVVKEDGNKE